MGTTEYESALQNPYIALLVGVAVSLDVIALTFCSWRIYSSEWRTWARWGKYNAGWHAGLLLLYLILIDLASVGVHYIAALLNIDISDYLGFLAPAWTWISEKFRSHIVVYAALGAMGWVWFQYGKKVVGVPTAPQVEEAPALIRPIFRRGAERLSDPDSRWFWHLSACLVAIDMLALAAVIKSGEKLLQFPRGFDGLSGSFSEINADIANAFNAKFLLASLWAIIAVFCVVWILCILSAFLSRYFWKNIAETIDVRRNNTMAVFIVVALRLLEPLVIFYFIIHSMAFLATGVPLHNPAFLLGSGFLIAALIQYVGFGNLIDAAQAQVDMAVSLAPPDGGTANAR